MNMELDDLPPRYRAQAEQQLAARKRRAADPLAEAVKQAKAAGRDFDSRGEYEFYTGTVLPKMARGEIVECEQHPAFPLFPAGEYGTIKRIGESIAGRYGLGFTYDADDYDIECDEQDGTDSSYYNTLCKNYGLILKVYAKRLWIYDRERYKGKRAVQDFDRTNIIPGSLSYNTTLSGTYTGGYFTYTDADKDLDIVCSVGGGNHTKNVNRRATSVYDASVQLCAEINNANHGRVKLKFSVMGNWGVSAGNNLRLTGYGDGLNGGINGKYFVDKVTHKYTKSGGFVTSFECSGIFDPFHYWDVGGHIEYHQSEDSSSESYNSAYETTSPAANAASAAAGATAGAAVTLTKAPFYYTSVAPKPSCYKSGTFYFYDGILVNNRYRITNTAARCGKLPVGKNVTGWVPASYCNGGGITTK